MQACIRLSPARLSDVEMLLQWVAEYHALEQIDFQRNNIQASLETLISDHTLGRIWLIHGDDQAIGYIALCFGYSIEMCGRDAFIDELYIIPSARGKGFGRRTLELVIEQLDGLAIRALHLEVAHSNDTAKHLYRSVGFKSRKQFHLMTLKP